MSATRLPPARRQQEFAAGKNLIGGDYVLPSGKQLPFGAMIARLKRQRVLEDVMAVGGADGGRRWQR